MLWLGQIESIVILLAASSFTCCALAPGGVEVTTFAGRPGSAGGADGIPGGFHLPYGLAFGASGTLYVGDQKNHAIRKVSKDGMVSTFVGKKGSSGSQDGTGSQAFFDNPAGIAFDPQGNLYIADRYNYAIRRTTPQGVVTTLAGEKSVSGSSDGIGVAAHFSYPYDVTVGSDGYVYVADSYNNAIRRISSGGEVTTFVGKTGTPGSRDGIGTNALFDRPFGLAFDSKRNLFISDYNNHAIRKADLNAKVVQFAGKMKMPGFMDGIATVAQFRNPRGLAFDKAGDLYAADAFNNAIRKITPDGTVSTIAGGAKGRSDGFGTGAQFDEPSALAFDSSGDLFVADQNNHIIRKLDMPEITIIAATETASISRSLTRLPIMSPTVTPTPWTPTTSMVSPSHTLLSGTPSESLLGSESPSAPTSSLSATVQRMPVSTATESVQLDASTSATQSISMNQGRDGMIMTASVSVVSSAKEGGNDRDNSNPAAAVLATVLPSSAAQVIAAVGGASTVAAGAIVPPAATQYARVGAVLRSVLCILSENDDAPSYVEFPLQFPLGSGSWAHFAGACFSNALLVCVTSAALLILSRTQSDSSSKRASHGAEICGTTAALVAAYFIPNTVSASSTLMFANARSGLELAVAIFGLCVCCFAVVRPLQATMFLEKYVKWTSCVEKSKISVRYESIRKPSIFLECFGKFFGDARDPDRMVCRILYFEELLAACVCVFLAGIRPSPGSCVYILLPLAFIAVVHLAYSLLIRPYNRKLPTLFSIVSSVTVVVICGVGYFVLQDSAKMQYLAYPLMVQNAIFLIQAIVEGFWVYVVTSKRRVKRYQMEAMKALLGNENEDTAVLMLPKHANPLTDAASADLA